MIRILTYNDLTTLGGAEKKRREFIMTAIRQHVASDEYKTAVIADEYYHLKNPTIMRVQKMLYNIYGKAVPDIWSPNHRIPSNWYMYFTNQAVGHLLSNGVYFSSAETKGRLGKNFDRNLVLAATEAHNGGIAFGFWNYDRLVVFTIREFVPLYDEFSGELSAGIRFWQISSDKPMMITLYEPDGVTEYIKDNDDDLRERAPKQDYKRIIKTSAADGAIVVGGGNYARLPIVPLKTPLGQSDIVGNRYVIDAYDLIASGLINNTDEGNFVYWVLQNCDGMSMEDDEKFVEQLKTTHVAHANGDEGAVVNSHTVETPVDAHKLSLEELRSLLFTNFMAVDVQKIAGGNTTATEIRAAYEPLNSKNDMFEGCVSDFILGILDLAGLDDVPSYKRSQVVNEAEATEMVLSAATYLDDETILRKIPWITVDEVGEIMDRKIGEDMARFTKAGGAAG